LRFTNKYLGASDLSGLCCKEWVIQHHHLGASGLQPDRAIRLYLFCLRQKRIPLLSLAQVKAFGFHLSKMGSRGAYGGYTALLSQAASLYSVL
jgi:hypothetical protein